MSRRFLCLLVLLSSLLAFRPALADDSSGGTVTSIVGKPKMSTDGGQTFNVMAEGDTIPVGAVIHTGTGKVALLLSDGSLVRLAQDSEITLSEHDPNKAGGGTIFQLAAGFARFLVSKVKSGNHFEVHSPDAVAAVKGTDFEVGLNGDGKFQVWVFPKDNLGKVELSDIKSLMKILITESNYGSFDGKTLGHGTFDPKSFNDPVGGDTGGAGAGKAGEGKGSNISAADAAALQGAQEKVAAALAAQFSDLASNVKQQIQQQKIQIAQSIGQNESADILQQRLVTDQNGDLTLVTHSVSFPSPASVDLLTTDFRSGGINKGATIVNEDTTFNAPIGSNWVAALQAPVNPTLYRTLVDFTAQDPQGDSLVIVTNLVAPQYEALTGLYMQDASGVISTLAGGGAAIPTITDFQLQSGGSGSYNSYLGVDGIDNGSGGSTDTQTLFDLNNDTLETTVYVETICALIGQGSGTQVYNNGGNDSFASPSQYYTANIGSYDSVLAGQEPYCIEMNLTWNNQASSDGIDAVFLPGFFDLYYMSPAQSYGISDFAP